MTRRTFLLTALAAVAAVISQLRRGQRKTDDAEVEWQPGDALTLYVAPEVSVSGGPARPIRRWDPTKWYIDPPHPSSLLATNAHRGDT